MEKESFEQMAQKLETPEKRGFWKRKPKVEEDNSLLFPPKVEPKPTFSPDMLKLIEEQTKIITEMQKEIFTLKYGKYEKFEEYLNHNTKLDDNQRKMIMIEYTDWKELALAHFRNLNKVEIIDFLEQN